MEQKEEESNSALRKNYFSILEKIVDNASSFFFLPRWFEVGRGRNRRKEVKRLALRSPRVLPPPLLLCYRTYVFTRPSRESVNYSVQKPVYILLHRFAQELIHLSKKKRKRESIFLRLRYSTTFYPSIDDKNWFFASRFAYDRYIRNLLKSFLKSSNQTTKAKFV